MRAAAVRCGYEFKSRARQIPRAYLGRFDLILTMDENNRSNVLALAESAEQRARVRRFLGFCRKPQALEVPDP